MIHTPADKGHFVGNSNDQGISLSSPSLPSSLLLSHASRLPSTIIGCQWSDGQLLVVVWWSVAGILLTMSVLFFLLLFIFFLKPPTRGESIVVSLSMTQEETVYLTCLQTSRDGDFYRQTSMNKDPRFLLFSSLSLSLSIQVTTFSLPLSIQVYTHNLLRRIPTSSNLTFELQTEFMGNVFKHQNWYRIPLDLQGFIYGQLICRFSLPPPSVSCSATCREKVLKGFPLGTLRGQKMVVEAKRGQANHKRGFATCIPLKIHKHTHKHMHIHNHTDTHTLVHTHTRAPTPTHRHTLTHPHTDTQTLTPTPTPTLKHTHTHHTLSLFFYRNTHSLKVARQQNTDKDMARD